MSNRLTIILINVIIFYINLFVFANKSNKISPPVINWEPDHQFTSIENWPIFNYDIDDPVPSYKNYNETCKQLEIWNSQCPDLVDIGTYGKSARNISLNYIKIENEFVNDVKPVVLITACIHGNEPLSSSTVMGYIGTILDKYGDDKQITDLVDSRVIYLIPVVSPDSYPHSRYVNGVDPNRNFPTANNPDKKSVPPVLALQKFFKEINPNAVISGHTWGRVYLTPYGDRTNLCPNDSDYKRIMGEMGRMSDYRVQRACEMYNRPIYGTEVDWYYRHGSFSIVMEFGTHQIIPSKQDIDIEFNRTFKAVLYFIEEAPLVEVIGDKNEF